MKDWSKIGPRLVQDGNIKCLTNFDYLERDSIAAKHYLIHFSNVVTPGKIYVPNWNGISIPKFKLYGSILTYHDEAIMNDYNRFIQLQNNNLIVTHSLCDKRCNVGFIQIIFTDHSPLMKYVNSK